MKTENFGTFLELDKHFFEKIALDLSLLHIMVSYTSLLNQYYVVLTDFVKPPLQKVHFWKSLAERSLLQKAFSEKDSCFSEKIMLVVAEIENLNLPLKASLLNLYSYAGFFEKLLVEDVSSSKNLNWRSNLPV